MKLKIGNLNRFDNSFFIDKIIKIQNDENVNKVLSEFQYPYDHAVLYSKKNVVCEFSRNMKITKTKRESYWKIK